MISEEILFDIDQTLDRLIENAETIKDVNLKELEDEKVVAFQKTQESLLAHLVSMDELLDQKRKKIKIPKIGSVSFKIQEKIKTFENVDENFKSDDLKFKPFNRRSRKRVKVKVKQKNLRD